MKTLQLPYTEGMVAFEFQGQTFQAGGAYVTEDVAIGYPEFPRNKEGKLKEFVGQEGVMKSCQGEVLGKCFITAKWATPRSWVSSHRFQIEACIGGVYFTGRGFGHGMIWHAKRKKKQEWS